MVLKKPKMPKSKEKEKSKSVAQGPFDSKRILQAVSILKQLNQKFYEKKETKSLLDDENENPVILQITMKKIPPPTMQKFIKVRLPKSILSDQNEVCLITGDLDKRNTKAEVEPDVLHFKELLKKENVSQVNEVITLRQLRKEYKPFEARRQLCGAYDIFLCDKRIAGVLPRTLGKCFFKKRKLPIQINMQTPKLKEQIENALSSTVFHITCKGNSCSSEVAVLSMNEDDILANVKSSIDALKEQLPGQWDNVLGIYVKTPKSKAIPLYMSNDDPNEFNFAQKRTRSKAVTAELSTLDNTNVKVYRDGRVTVKRLENDDVDIEAPSKSLEEDSSNEKVEQCETKIEELIVSEEEADNDRHMAMKLNKRKGKSNIAANEESSQIEIPLVDLKEEAVEISIEPKKKNKKRKSELVNKGERSQLEIKKENLESSLVEKKMEKMSRKRKSNVNLDEESVKVDVKEENSENSAVKNVKRKNKKKKNQN